ncbi:MAG: FG-GAP-like repeat-containing protein [Candidatus Kryptonium sp.]
MLENRDLKIYRVFFFLFTFYFEVLISQNRLFPVFFINEITLPEGSSAFSIGDLNGDGFYDIVVSSQRAITCLENNHRNNFNFYFSIPVRESPADVKVSDIDNDNASEIIAVYKARSMVEIFKKDMLGFKRFYSFETGIYPDLLICSDLDLDGLKDVTTVGKIMLGITVNYQTKLNQFSNPVNFFPKIPFKKVQILDLNYDDVPDLVGIDWLNNLLVISYGRGDGKFGPAYTYKLPEEPNDFVVADLNNDGFFDYVISLYYLDEVQLYYTTQAGISLRFRFKIPKPLKVCAGDLDGNGFKDIVVSNAERLFVFMNSGRDFIKYEFSGEGVIQVECADLDANGRDDIVVLDSVGNRLRIFYSDAELEFSENFSIAVGLNSSDFAIADFNRDGYVDFVSVGDSSNSLLVYYNGGKIYSFLNQSKSFTDVKILSGPNLNYLFCSNYETGAVSLFRLKEKDEIKEIFRYNFDKPKPVFMGISEDGSVVIFLSISDSNLILIKPKGETEFDELSIKEIDSTKVIASAVGDLNGDRYFDVAVVNLYKNNIMLNIFSRKKEDEYVKSYSSNLNRLIKRAFLYIDDFNGDGYLDILIYYDYSTTKVSDGELNLFLNDETGKFRARKIDGHVYLANEKLLKIADFSGDFKKDFVVFDNLRGGVYLYINNNGVFEKKQVYSLRSKINSTGVADINHDGFPDLILLDEKGGSFRFLLNKDGFLK